jgi:cell filamentation protein
MDDPYVYPGSEILIKKLGIRDAGQLKKFERRAFVIRAETLPNDIPLTADGYRRIHRHLFQDVYHWAGQDRTVDIAKSNSYFCRAVYIGRELEKRFEAIRAENYLRGLDADEFAASAAEHLSELNAIHPFREGNGRTLRPFLTLLAEAAGHGIDLTRIDPDPWNEASRESFRTADARVMRAVIAGAVTR